MLGLRLPSGSLFFWQARTGLVFIMPGHYGHGGKKKPKGGKKGGKK